MSKRDIVIGIISGLLGTVVTSTIFQIANLSYPNPQWLALPMATIFMLIFIHKLTPVINDMLDKKRVTL